MCGIYLSVGHDPNELPDAVLTKLLEQRGPDSVRELKIRIKPRQEKTEDEDDDGQRVVHLTFIATVLSLRGDSVVEQPVVDESTGFILCWNGEAWRIGSDTVGACDTTAVFSHLQKAASCDCSDHDCTGSDLSVCEEDHSCASLSRALQAISSLKGPYALVFFDHCHQRLFFARDPLGRRSLVYRTTHLGSLVVASVSDGDTSKSWNEVEADGVYVVDYSITSGYTGSTKSGRSGNGWKGSTFPVRRYPWGNPAHTDGLDVSLGLVSSAPKHTDYRWWLSSGLAYFVRSTQQDFAVIWASSFTEQIFLCS